MSLNCWEIQEVLNVEPFLWSSSFCRQVIQSLIGHCEVPSNFALNSSTIASNRIAPSSSRGIDGRWWTIPYSVDPVLRNEEIWQAKNENGLFMSVVTTKRPKWFFAQTFPSSSSVSTEQQRTCATNWPAESLAVQKVQGNLLLRTIRRPWWCQQNFSKTNKTPRTNKIVQGTCCTIMNENSHIFQIIKGWSYCAPMQVLRKLWRRDSIFTTLDDAELEKLSGSRREYALLRDINTLSKVKGWIRGNTKIGSALEVAVSCHQGRYGIEIKIHTLFGDRNAFKGDDLEWNKQIRDRNVGRNPKRTTSMTLDTVPGNRLLKQDRNKHLHQRLLLQRSHYITSVSGSTSNQGSATKAVLKCQKRMTRLLRHDPTVLRDEDGSSRIRNLGTDVSFRIYIFSVCVNSNTLILHCKTMCCYRTTSPSTYHVVSSHDTHSIIQSGLIPGGKEFKKGSMRVFFTAVNPMFIDHCRERDYDVTKPRIAVYKHNWKIHQNTVYWLNVRVAQSKGLQFYQTWSNAIILYNTLPAVCIGKVVIRKSGEELHKKCIQSPIAPQRIVPKPNLNYERQDTTSSRENVRWSFWQARRNLWLWLQAPRIAPFDRPRARITPARKPSKSWSISSRRIRIEKRCKPTWGKIARSIQSESSRREMICSMGNMEYWEICEITPKL